MYHVGFGDCFLVTVPTNDGPRHILFDCGVHPTGNAGTMAAVVADIATECEGKLALVVATHEHADHISGFGKFAADFGRLEIGALWMPWAMDLGDPLATSLRNLRLKLAAQLALYFKKMGARQPAAVQDVLLNLTSNEASMEALRSGFRGAAKVRYLRAGDAPRLQELLPGIGVRVLGPPTDEKFLKKMEPPASQRYLRAHGAEEYNAGPIKPFGAKHFFKNLPEGRKAYGFKQRSKHDLSEADLRDSALESAEALAFTLDSVANNTSLVLLLTVGGRDLLFPGDAQWGSWLSWLDANDGPALENISFLKVSHHGSVNATPKRALEGMTNAAFAAMVSTQSVPFPTIPQGRLMERLGKMARKRVARSDAVAPGARRSTLPRAFKVGPHWVDYTARV